MRFYLIWAVVLFMCAYSWKDWYKSLCFLILLMAVIERPDMPKAMFGIPGFNPWNLLFLNILVAGYFAIKNDSNTIALPKNIKLLLIFYLFVVIVAFLREYFDDAGLRQIKIYMRGLGYPESQLLSKKDLIIEDLFNTIKYAIPGILVYFGCTNQKRFRWTCLALLLMNFVLAVLIVKSMPISALTDGEMLQKTAIRRIDRDIGYYRSDLAIVLAGGAWAMFAYRYNVKNKTLKLFLLIASGLTVLAIALTGGRMGMGGWIVVGALLALYRYRRFLILGPILVLIVITVIPSVQDRFTQGFQGEGDNFQTQSGNPDGPVDTSSVTSGRTVIWPFVIDKIGDAPLIGYGRRAMQRIGLASWLKYELNEVFPHPHNAYLQFLLDNGFLLALPVFWFYFLISKYSLRLYKEKDDTVGIATGAIGLSFVVSFIVGGVAQQSFYPFASAVGMWCSIGLVLRVYNEKYLLSQDKKKLDECNGQNWCKINA